MSDEVCWADEHETNTMQQKTNISNISLTCPRLWSPTLLLTLTHAIPRSPIVCYINHAHKNRHAYITPPQKLALSSYSTANKTSEIQARPYTNCPLIQ